MRHELETGAKEREEYLLKLDDELLKGGVILSEWAAVITAEFDKAFICGAFLASTITAVAAIETHLKSEYVDAKRITLFELIEKSEVPRELRAKLHELRLFRNKWVHVEDPWTDEDLLKKPEEIKGQLIKMAWMAASVLREVLYSDQWI